MAARVVGMEYRLVKIESRADNVVELKRKQA
jgi:hypothetical protein